MPASQTESEFDSPKMSERFVSPTADIVLRSSNGVTFKAHRETLIEASPVFHGMFEVPQPAAPGSGSDSLPVVDLAETDEIIDALLRWIYPCPDKPKVDSWEHLESYLEAACKYEIGAPIAFLLETLGASRFLTASPVRAYGVASWLKTTHALDTSEFILTARQRIITTDIDMINLDLHDVGKISGADVLDLMRTRSVYCKAVEHILSPTAFNCTGKCANGTPSWWRDDAWRPWTLSKAKHRTSSDPILSDMFIKGCTGSLTCYGCRTSMQGCASVEVTLHKLWETGSFAGYLKDWFCVRN